MRSEAAGAPQFTEGLENPVGQPTKVDASKADFATALHQATGNTASARASTPLRATTQETYASNDVQKHPKDDVGTEDVIASPLSDSKLLPFSSETAPEQITSNASKGGNHLLQFSENAETPTRFRRLPANFQLNSDRISQREGISKTHDVTSHFYAADIQEKIKASEATNIASTATPTELSVAFAQSPVLIALSQQNINEQKQTAQKIALSERMSDTAKATNAVKDGGLAKYADGDPSSEDTQNSATITDSSTAILLAENSNFSFLTTNRRDPSIQSGNITTSPILTAKNESMVGRTADVKRKAISQVPSDGPKIDQEAIAPESGVQFSLAKNDLSTAPNASTLIAALASSIHGVPAPGAINPSDSSVTSGHSAGIKNTFVANSSTTAQLPLTTTSGEVFPHTMLSATPNTLEVGVTSGTHGWLKIRAELTGTGEVNASLTGGSVAAANRLRGDLPALNSYLQAEKVQVSGLDVRALSVGIVPIVTGSDRSIYDGSNGLAGSSDSESRQPQHNGQGGNTVSVTNGSEEGSGTLLAQAPDVAVFGNEMELGGNENLSSVGYMTSGSWLNVRA